MEQIEAGQHAKKIVYYPAEKESEYVSVFVAAAGRVKESSLRG